MNSNCRIPTAHGHESSRRIAAVACAIAVTVWFVPAWLIADESLADRQSRIEELPASERRELVAKYERFEQLPKEEQQRLRDLHSQIESQPDAERLRRVLTRYGEWLGTLTASQRKSLAALPAEERMAEISRIKRRSEERMLGHLTQSKLSPEDARRVFTWLDQLVAEQEESLRAQLDDREKRWLAMTRDPTQRRSILVRMVMRKQGIESLPKPQEAQIEQLVTTLSETAQQEYRSLEDEPARADLVREWIQAAMLSRLMPPPVSEEELQRFYLEDLPAEEREELDRMPRDLMMGELHKRYVRNRLRRNMGGEGDFPFGPRPWDRSPRRGPRFDREDGSRENGPWEGGPRDGRPREEGRRGPRPDDRPGPPPDGFRGPPPDGFRGPPPDDRPARPERPSPSQPDEPQADQTEADETDQR